MTVVKQSTRPYVSGFSSVRVCLYVRTSLDIRPYVFGFTIRVSGSSFSHVHIRARARKIKKSRHFVTNRGLEGVI